MESVLLLAIFACSCQSNGIDHVDYKQFVNLLDWKDHPLPKEPRTVSHQFLPRMQLYHNFLPQDPAGAFGETFSGFCNWTKTLGLISYPQLISDLQSQQ